MSETRDFWNARYQGAHPIYGERPNDFLAANAQALLSPVLSLGEGEGRNAVFLAERGVKVTGLDASELGLEKARAFAARRNVSIETVHADLETYDLGVGRWGAVVSIWCHLPKPLRERVHAGIVRALVPGGVFLAELYTPRQLAFGTGGPKAVEMLAEPTDLRAELSGLVLERCEELERDVQEGALHSGRSAVVQVLARKPR